MQQVECALYVEPDGQYQCHYQCRSAGMIDALPQAHTDLVALCTIGLCYQSVHC